MPTKIIVVTASDARYAPLAHDLMLSLRQHRFPMSFDIGLLDVGLTDELVQHFTLLGAKVKQTKTHIDFPARKLWEKKQAGVKTLIARLFMREYFPSYDYYIWIDADIWVQTPEAITTVIETGCSFEGIAITAEMDRCYGDYFGDGLVWHRQKSWYEASYDSRIVEAMMFKPMLNAGFFGLRHESAIWKSWVDIYQGVLQQTGELTEKNFMADQLGLNILLYLKGLPCIILPTTFNWLTAYAIPKFDRARNYYVETFSPYLPLSQIHLTQPNKMAEEKIQCLDGTVLERPLTFRRYQTG